MRNPVLSVVAVTAGVLLLAGCVGGDPTETAPPTVTIDEVSVPDSMMPTEPYAVADSTIIPAVDGLPALFGGGLAAPGEGSLPTVWSSVDGTAWAGTDVDPDFTGSFSGDIAGSSELSALAGVAWESGKSRTVLYTSTDRETWTAIDLPDDFATTYRATDATVSGSTVVVIATSADGESRGIRVEGKDATAFDLPDPGEDNQLNAGIVVARDQELVLVASPGPEGEPNDTAAYVSDDLGESWGDSAPITDKLGYVSGVAVTDSGFVATGAVPRGEGSVSGVAAWFSADGTTWSAESVPAPSDEGSLFYYGSADARLGAPVANAGVTVAIMGNDNAAISGVYQRDVGGQWSLIGQTSINSGNGVGGIAMSIDGSTITGFLGDSGALRTGTFSGGGWNNSGEIAARSDVASAYTVDSVGERILATLTTPTFTVDSDLGWRNSTVYGLGELSGDSLTEVPWDPARAGELTNVRLASDESGAELVLGSSFPVGGDVILAEAFFRASPDTEFVPAVGFDTGGATFFYKVAKIGDSWVAVGQSRETSSVGDPEHGVIWTSADGVTWGKPSGDFGSGALETSINDVCALPDGTGVAVGWVEESAGSYRTAVWMPEGEGWARTDIGDIGTKSGSAGDCASGEDGVIMSASISGRDTLQLSTDGSTWTETFRAGRGVTLGEPVAVSGGFAASGSLVNDDFSGPVVWLSADGKDWSPVSVPSVRSGATLAVAAYGDDLVVTMGGRTGHPVSIVRDIAKVISG